MGYVPKAIEEVAGLIAQSDTMLITLFTALLAVAMSATFLRKGNYKKRIAALALFLLLPFVQPYPLVGQNGPGKFNYKKATENARKFLFYLADSQAYHFTQHNRWAGQKAVENPFEILGLTPDNDNNYAFYCGDHYILPESSKYAFEFPDPADEWPYILYPKINDADFTCMAIGNNDRDRFPDIWMVNKFKKPVHLLDDHLNKILVDIVNKPFDPKLYFTDAFEKSAARELSNLYIEINIPAYRLDLYEGGRHVKSFPIAVGMTNFKTPVRTFYIERMEWNPWWIPPNASWCKKKDEDGKEIGCKPVGPGAWNPLGPVKMIMQSSFLIHGTNKSWSIGKKASHGCIRMYSKNALELGWKVMVLSGAKQKLTAWNRYNDKSRRTYKIVLLRPVQVNTIYERLEIHDNKLLLHPDNYRWQRMSSDEIKEKIEKLGVSLENMPEEKRASLLHGNPSETIEIQLDF